MLLNSLDEIRRVFEHSNVQKTSTHFQRLTAIQVKLICVVILAMPYGQAAAHPFDGSEVANLSGKVKKIVVDPANGLVNTYSFDQDRHLIEVSFQLAAPNQDSSWPRAMKFDYKGGLRLSALLSHPDGFSLRTAYGYNDTKQCTAEVTTYIDGTFYEAILRQYGESDNLTDELQFALREGLIEVRHFEGGTLVSEWRSGMSGPLLRRGGRDEDTGRLSEVLYHDSSKGSDDEGIDLLKWSIKLYDGQRNVIAMLGFSRKGTLIYLSQNNYEYDNMGNWVVSETQYSFPGVEGGPIRYRTTREITYFDEGTDKPTP